MKSNFDKNDISEADYQGTPYDYTSIMQYGKTAFRKMGAGNTMESKFNPNQPLGGPKLSSWDILELNRRYQCKHEDAAGNIVPASEINLFIARADLDTKLMQLKHCDGE